MEDSASTCPHPNTSCSYWRSGYTGPQPRMWTLSSIKRTIVDVWDGCINKRYAGVHWSVGCEYMWVGDEQRTKRHISTDDKEGFLGVVCENKSALSDSDSWQVHYHDTTQRQSHEYLIRIYAALCVSGSRRGVRRSSRPETPCQISTEMDKYLDWSKNYPWIL